MSRDTTVVSSEVTLVSVETGIFSTDALASSEMDPDDSVKPASVAKKTNFVMAPSLFRHRFAPPRTG